MTALIATLAVGVAIQYIFIGLYIVPKLARLAEERGMAIRFAQWGAAAFFVGCGLTHIGIAMHTLEGLYSFHDLLVHFVVHLAQVGGGAIFSYIAWQKIDVRFTPRGYEEQRREAERERERSAALFAQRAGENEAVARLGQLGLKTNELSPIFREALEIVANTLDADVCELMEHVANEEAFQVIAGVGWSNGIVGSMIPAEAASQAALALSRNEAVLAGVSVEASSKVEKRVEERGVVSSASVVVPGGQRPFGVLAAHKTTGVFTRENVDFLTSVANVVASAIGRVVAEDAARRQAMYDPLTALPNRTLFLDRVDQALARQDRANTTVTVFLLDLDQFRVINNSLGHQVGDELLVALAPRFREVVRDNDTVARLGGDEFAVLAEDMREGRDVVQVAERLCEAAARPTQLISGDVSVKASVGIALSGPQHQSSSNLLRQADAAMYRAKQRGGGRYELFDEATSARALQRLQDEQELRDALERGELHLAYQPIADLSNGRYVAVEALLRWEHPRHGNVPPVEFIGVAEESGLIVPIGEWVLKEACTQVARWQAELSEGAPLRLCVNISGRQILDGGLSRKVRAAMTETGLAPGTLLLEITESVLMEEAESPLDALSDLKSVGARLVLDDFGTGYSSLSYLSSFPLDVVKIDRSFVARLARSDRDASILGAIVSMARALEMAVVAEGVETEDQLRRLRALACDQAQGYYLCRPLSPQDLAAHLSARRVAHAGSR